MAHRPEIDLLLCCARTSLSSEKIYQIRALLDSRIDWPYLIRIAEAQGLLPLLYFNLQRTLPDLVPGSILDQLHVRFLANAGRNLFLTQQLIKILDLFQTNAISAIPFRGPTLAVFLYGDLALRSFGDLDILVRRQDIQTAKALLISHGYRLDLSLTQEQETAFLHSDSEGWFARHDGQVRVEIHWGEPKDFPFTLDLEPFWERLEKSSFEGRMVLSFPPEDMLLLLCVHGAEHCWERLIWVCDLTELLRVHQGMDWSGLMNQAEVLGCRRTLFLGLFLACDLLGTTVPAEISKRIQIDSSVRSLAGQIHERLSQKENGPIGTWERSLFNLKVTEHLRHRISYCLRIAFHPTVVDWKALPLPQSLFFLYHFIHPLRVAGKYGWHYLKHLFRKAIPS